MSAGNYCRMIVASFDVLPSPQQSDTLLPKLNRNKKSELKKRNKKLDFKVNIKP